MLGSLKRYTLRQTAQPKQPLALLIDDDEQAVLSCVERVLSAAG
jgi:hypothetical protein